MTEKEIASLGIEDLIVRDLRPDSKYSLVQGRIMHQEKNYLIPVDEPVYVTVGSDPTALSLAEFYHAALHDETQSNIVVDHIKSSSNRVEAFSDFYEDVENVVGDLNYQLSLSPAEADNTFAAIEAMDSLADKKQSAGYLFWDFKLFDRADKQFLDPEMPVMIYRGKDALLVQIIDKHTEMLNELDDDNIDFAYKAKLLEYAAKDREAVLKFHTEKPHRCGVTCSLFSSQEAKGDAYKKAMASAESYEALQHEIDGE